MNASLSRVAGRVWYVATTLLLLTISVCANAQSSMTIAVGDNQSAYAGQRLPNDLSVAFSPSSYVTLDWSVTGGAVFDTNFSSNYSTTVDTSMTPTFSIGVYNGSSAGPYQVTVTCSSGCTTVQT